MKKLILASHNKSKLIEISNILCSLDFELVSCADFGIVDIPETGTTFEENAVQKIDFVAKRVSNGYILADDFGFCIDSLGGAPGVYSARFAPSGDFGKAMDLILERIKDVPVENRGASFVCAIALYVPNDKTYVFEGTVKGTVAFERKGTSGFGYDEIFIPKGFEKTFAEMDMEEKSSISHRGIALEEIVRFLGKNEE